MFIYNNNWGIILLEIYMTNDTTIFLYNNT